LSFSPGGPTTDPRKTDASGGALDKASTVQKSWRLLKFSSVGIEMAVATFIGWLVGHWLDLQLGTDPWLMLVFLLLGVAAGFKGVFRAAKEAQELLRQADAGETGAPPAESKQTDGGAGPGEDRT
jgi:ATP synthase protein I